MQKDNTFSLVDDIILCSVDGVCQKKKIDSSVSSLKYEAFIVCICDVRSKTLFIPFSSSIFFSSLLATNNGVKH